MYVANESKPTSLTIYAPGASGDARPIAAIKGSGTKPNLPAGANGSVAPFNTIKGKRTDLYGPEGIAIR